LRNPLVSSLSSSSLPSVPSPPLVSLFFFPDSLPFTRHKLLAKKNKVKGRERREKGSDAHFTHFGVIMTATTQLVDPITPRSIQDEDESVRIAVRALGDMRNGTLLHPPSISCARLLPHLPHYPLPTHPALMILAFQPTPALSIASSSNSPTLTTPTLASEDPELDPEAADFVARVSTFPVVGSALRAYEQSKASSRVVKVPCHFYFPRTIFRKEIYGLSSTARR
jgi:hypothetical protein